MCKTVNILKSATPLVNKQLLEVIGKPKDKTHFMRMIHQIVALSERYDDNDAVDALCYIIAVTNDSDVMFHALTVIDKVRGR